MALLEDDELDDRMVVQPSDTHQPLFDDSEPEPYKIKDKKDRRLRVEEKRGSVRSLPWGKSKDSSLEKTPKKTKHNRNKSGSRTPPDSPKAVRSDELRKTPKGGVPPQPSPNVKSNRKSYSQLDDVSDDDQDEEKSYTVLNQPALEQEQHPPTNPWASSSEDKPSSPPNSLFPDTPHADPWFQASSNWRTTVQFPVLFGDTLATSPDRPGRGSLPLTNMQQFGGFPSPIQEPRPLTSYQPVTALPTPPQPLAPPLSQLPSAIIQPSTEPDWSISDELWDKCMSQFKELSSSSGLLQGDKAREFFVQSKLPFQELSTIWRLADMDKDNALSEHEFCVAMKLVMIRRKGYEIPTSLPQVLLSAPLLRTFSDNFGSHGGPSPPPSVDRGSPVDTDAVVQTSQGDTHTGVLVDLDGDTFGRGEWEDDGDEDTALVMTRRRTGSEGSIPKKPVRPAPPVPKVQRSKTIKAPPSNSGEERSSPSSEVEGILITIDQGTPQVPRKSSKNNDYAPLDSSDQFSTNPPGNDSTDGFGWQQLDGKSQSDLDPPDSGPVKRAHHRGRSLDLTKVIQAGNNKDVLENLPSAVPPKPPPRPHQSPPLEQFRASVRQGEDEGGDTKSGRVRSLSTGSITKHTSPEHQGVELETKSLIKEKPKARKVRMPPRRPPPPVKPSKLDNSHVPGKVDLREYQVPGDKANRDKKELQSTIRSLKDQNALLTEFNKTLEGQLFKLIEERVKLERELEFLN